MSQTKPLIAGAMKDRMTFIQVSEAISPSGEPVPTETAIKAVFCNYRSVRGKEVFTFGEQIGQPEAVFQIRFKSHTPNASQRILFRGVKYEIVAPPVEIGFKDGWEIYAKVWGPNG